MCSVVLICCSSLFVSRCLDRVDAMAIDGQQFAPPWLPFAYGATFQTPSIGLKCGFDGSQAVIVVRSFACLLQVCQAVPGGRSCR